MAAASAPKVVAKTSVHINTCFLFTPFIDEISALEHSLVIRKALPYREKNVFALPSSHTLIVPISNLTSDMIGASFLLNTREELFQMNLK